MPIPKINVLKQIEKLKNSALIYAYRHRLEVTQKENKNYQENGQRELMLFLVNKNDQK